MPESTVPRLRTLSPLGNPGAPNPPGLRPGANIPRLRRFERVYDVPPMLVKRLAPFRTCLAKCGNQSHSAYEKDTAQRSYRARDRSELAVRAAICKFVVQRTHELGAGNIGQPVGHRQLHRLRLVRSVVLAGS